MKKSCFLKTIKKKSWQDWYLFSSREIFADFRSWAALFGRCAWFAHTQCPARPAPGAPPSPALHPRAQRPLAPSPRPRARYRSLASDRRSSTPSKLPSQTSHASQYFWREWPRHGRALHDWKRVELDQDWLHHGSGSGRRRRQQERAGHLRQLADAESEHAQPG